MVLKYINKFCSILMLIMNIQNYIAALTIKPWIRQKPPSQVKQQILIFVSV